MSSIFTKIVNLVSLRSRTKAQLDLITQKLDNAESARKASHDAVIGKLDEIQQFHIGGNKNVKKD